MNLKIETIRKITMFLQNVDVEMIEFVKKRRIKVVKTDLKETRIRDLIEIANIEEVVIVKEGMTVIGMSAIFMIRMKIYCALYRTSC